MPVYTWHGENPKGTVCGGKITREAAALPAFVRDRFERGWRRLTVTRDGTEVAAIGRQGDRPQRRTWWAEGGDPDGSPGQECICGSEIKRVPLPPDLAALSGRSGIWVHLHNADTRCYPESPDRADAAMKANPA